MANPTLEEAVDILVYSPSDEEMQAKAAFWGKAHQNPQINPDNITLATVDSILADSRLKRWWGRPGFKEWFTNKDEWVQKLEYAIQVGVDRMIQLFSESDPKLASAQVRAFEVLARLANREPARVKEVKLLDRDIQDMDQKTLNEYIERNLKLLGKSEV
jgi:hypothetical protein